MTAWALILIITLPNGGTLELVENQFTTKAACEERANFYHWNFHDGRGSYVNGAVCLPLRVGAGTEE